MAEKNHRLCVSCRKIAHRDTLWRIVRTFPDHHIQLDEGMGRSAYLCPEANCLNAVQKKNRLGRVLRTKVPPQIYQALAERLVRGEMDEAIADKTAVESQARPQTP